MRKTISIILALSLLFLLCSASYADVANQKIYGLWISQDRNYTRIFNINTDGIQYMWFKFADNSGNLVKYGSLVQDGMNKNVFVTIGENAILYRFILDKDGNTLSFGKLSEKETLYTKFIKME